MDGNALWLVLGAGMFVVGLGLAEVHARQVPARSVLLRVLAVLLLSGGAIALVISANSALLP